MLEKMMAMAQVIKNLSVENEQLKETRKRNRYINLFLEKNVRQKTKTQFLYTFSASFQRTSSYPKSP
jgi:predicted ABC-type exoprotein transport system permease subunit